MNINFLIVNFYIVLCLQVILVRHLSFDVVTSKSKNINFPMFKKQIIPVLEYSSKFLNTMFLINMIISYTNCLIGFLINHLFKTNCSFSVL